MKVIDCSGLRAYSVNAEIIDSQKYTFKFSIYKLGNIRTPNKLLRMLPDSTGLNM